MQGNDLSNDLIPKLSFVVEGLIARVPEEDTKKAERALRRGKWTELAEMYVFDGKMVAHLWDMIWRTPYNFSLITVAAKQETWAVALERRFDRYNIPCPSLLAFESADALAAHLAFMPNLLRVYHGREDWRFKFGHAGEFVSDVNVFEAR